MHPTSMKPILEFRPSHFHNRVLADYTESFIDHGEFLKIPYMFSKHSAYELRDAFIDAFNKHSTYCISEDDECADWEKLIKFLMETERTVCGKILFYKVLGAYVSRSGWLSAFRAIRFAISLLKGKHGVLLSLDNQIVKIIFGRLNKGLHIDTYNRDPKIKFVGRKMALEGLFAVLPEIEPLLQAMLNSLFKYTSILTNEETPAVDYSPEDFVQVERALKIILREQQHDTSFRPFIEKMAQLHKERFKKLSRHEAMLQTAKQDPWSHVKNQAILDETVRVLRLAAKDNALNGEARRLTMERSFAERP